MQPLPATGQETGIDMGVASFATLSNGTRIFHPGWYRKAERRLKTAQRCVSRRQKGSHRRRKAVTLLAKAHLKVKRQRQDFHHKEARKLVQQYDTIYLEDLQVANMVKNHRLAKSIADASAWVPPLEAKQDTLASRRRRATCYTSRDCSGCGLGAAWALVGRRGRKIYPCATHLPTQTVGWYWTAMRTRREQRAGPAGSSGAVAQAAAEHLSTPACMRGCQ
jgi:transposase